MESTGGSVSVSGVLLGGAGSALPWETSLARHASTGGSRCPLSSVYAIRIYGWLLSLPVVLSVCDSPAARIYGWLSLPVVLSVCESSAMVQTACGPKGSRPPWLFFSFFHNPFVLIETTSSYAVDCLRRSAVSLVKSNQTKTTLSGGSLGSCVDEERSQLRELM